MRSCKSLALAALVLGAPLAHAEEQQQAPERISFDEALKRAGERNPSFEAAAADVARSEALVRESRAAWYPQFTANAVVTQLDHDRKLADRVLSPATSAGGNLQLTVPIVNAQRWNQTWRANDTLQVTRASAADVKRQVAVATARAYLAVVAQHRLVDVSERALKSAQDHFDYAHDRRVAGVGNRMDELRAQQELATSRQQLAQAQAALARAQEGLGVLVASEKAVDVAGDVSLPAAPSADQAVNEARGKRSDLVALDTRLQAAQRAVKESWTDYMPLLSAVAQPFFQAPATATQPNVGWQAQLVLSIPLYDGGLRYGQQQERAAVVAQAKAAIDGASRQLGADVRAAFESVRHNDDALEAAREAAKVTNETLELSTLAYKAGATNNLEVIDAEKRARDAATQAVVAEDAARQSRLELLSASGRFP